MIGSTGDAVVDAVLANLAGGDPQAAAAARVGFESLSAGESLGAVTGHGLADFLWYQLPVKWMCPLADKLAIAAGLGALFEALGKPRYAAMCTGPATREVLSAYEQRGRGAGVKAYYQALAATGFAPPDVPGLLRWGRVMGGDEAGCYWSVAVALEQAIDAGELTPGARGWRQSAARITTEFLHRGHSEVPGTSWLQWLHTERLQRWAEARGPGRRRLAGQLADRLTTAAPVPVDAEACLAPVRWLLGHAAGAGAALTQTGNLARALVAEGCRRFDWLTLSGNPRSESDIIELMTLRELAAQMGAVRRSGRRLLLTRHGASLHTGDTESLWQAAMACLLAGDEAHAAAGETALVLLLDDDQRLDYRTLTGAVAEVMAQEGWHNQRTGTPVDSTRAAGLLGHLNGRLQLLGLEQPHRYDQPRRLTPAGRAGAHAACAPGRCAPAPSPTANDADRSRSAIRIGPPPPR